MRVAKIRIQNILGIEELEIEPGSLTVIRGGNGRGKTSTMEAIQSVLQGGHDASLVRTGAEVGEVVLVLDDGVQITKRITAERSSVSVTHPELGGLKGPQGYIGRLTDALSINPVSFLTAPAKKRAEHLLEAIPLEVTVEELTEAIGPGALSGPLNPSWAEGHALEVISRVHRSVYEKRTEVNRTAKDKRATVAELSESLPAEGETVDEERLAQLEEEDAALAQRRIDESTKVSEKAKSHREATRAEAEERLEELRVEMLLVKEEMSSKTLLIDKAEDRALRAVREEIAPKQEEVRTEGRVLQERAKEAARHANTRRIAEGLAREAEEAEARSRALSDALAGLDGLKGSLLERLPIPGIEVRDGEIYRDGIPFDRLNRATQVQLAIDVARLRAGTLGLICVDGLECLDKPTFRAFCERAAEEDLQLIVTRVSEGAFEVESLQPAGKS